MSTDAPSTAKPLTAVEGVKELSRHLRGSLAAELHDGTDHFSTDSTHLVKFHGFYQQDDRDVRRERTAKKLPLLYSCMVRAAVPGGVLTADQWVTMDRLAGEVAANAPRGAGGPAPNLRITTRQGIQYHFVAKPDLHPLISGLNERLVTTLAACGDVARNVMGCPAPLAARHGIDLADCARPLAAHVRPRTKAYWELWVDGDKAAGAEAPLSAPEAEIEPLYGDTYLPRKFKMVFAWPGDNCVDLFSHDLGFVPTAAGGSGIEGFAVFAGGGMGQSHSREQDTYPRLASPIGWVPYAAVGLVAEAVIGTFRDHGDRTDRARARLKYLIDDRGLDWFRADVQARLSERGVSLEEAPALQAWTDDDEHLGWHEQADGSFFRGIHVDAGRIVDADRGTGPQDGPRLRSALATLAASGLVREVRLTPRQDVLLTGIAADRRAEIDEVLAAHRVAGHDGLTAVRRLAVACPALPTCGQALAEAERILPRLVADVEAAAQAAGLDDQAVRMHVTGCPNGCARPYTAELGIVGRTKRTYDVYVGGSVAGDRLNLRLGTDVRVEQLRPLFIGLFERFAAEREEGETIGDFCARAGVGELADTVPVAAPRRRTAEPA
ncbi:MAG: NADPH-dependent assimilatory sulfite reductase hemoprotein subunit [Acidimicrobiales bacterium]|nr:NADPH-dependent assimilatory sulfite reductase hemoprotein subunit [Acidimicrobiales bacterium]